MSREWFFSLCLIAILSSSGALWAQVGNSFLEEEKPFLKPYSPETNNQSLDASFKTNVIDTNKRNIGKVLNVPNKIMSSATPELSKSIQRHHQKSETQADTLKIGTPSSGLSFQGYNQSSSDSFMSFLDGYLLKSLHEKIIVRKKAEDAKSSDGTLLKKKKGTFIK
jgi:hypothetical protein